LPAREKERLSLTPIGAINAPTLVMFWRERGDIESEWMVVNGGRRVICEVGDDGVIYRCGLRRLLGFLFLQKKMV
jgi:hypothetical protein